MKSLIAIAILASCMASTTQGAGQYRGWFRQTTCRNGACSVPCRPTAVRYPASNNHVLPSTNQLIGDAVSRGAGGWYRVRIWR